MIWEDDKGEDDPAVAVLIAGQRYGSTKLRNNLMKNDPGGFLKGELGRLSMWGAAGAGSLIGLSIGVLLPYVVGERFGPFGVTLALIVTAAAVYCAICILERHCPWSLVNLKKGADAEDRVGHLLEYAMFAQNCAVAHGVTEIAKVGDIDHIIATPEGIWIIETKYKFVPRDELNDKLKRIAKNMKAVRKWACDEMKVEGCHVRGALVLAFEPKPLGKIEYDACGETIHAFTEKTLYTELIDRIRKEAQGEGPCNIAEPIWKLGKR